MSDGIYIALKGAVTEETKLDVVAQNLANAATVGYQRLRPVFHAALADATAGLATPTTSTLLDTTSGATRVTGRPLDMALPPGTYLAVGTSRGERYTRAGALAVGPSGNLAAGDGSAVLSDLGQPLKAGVDKGDVSLSESGEVFQDGASLGRMKLVSFTDPSRLAPEGGAVLAATSGSGAAAVTAGTVRVGALEESNTSVVGSMTELVSASRSFDAFQRAVDAFRDADQKVTSTVPNADQ